MNRKRSKEPAIKETAKKPLKAGEKDVSSTARLEAEKALLKVEQRYQRLVELSPDMIALHSDGKYVYINPAGLRILGASRREEIIGRSIFDIIHPESREKVDSRIQQLEAGNGVPPVEEKFIRLDGKCVDVEVSAVPLPYQGRPMVQLIARDITERKRTDEALKRSEEAAQRLAFERMIMAEIGQIISSSPDIEEVYALFSEKVKSLLSYDRIAINLINQDGSTLTDRYIEGISVPGRKSGETFPMAGTLTETVIQNRKGLIFDSRDEKEIAAKYPGLIPEMQAGFRSFLSVPLVSRDQPIGGLHLRSKTFRVYTEKDLKLAESIASQIAGAIANAQLFAGRQQAENALRASEEKYRLLVQNAKDAIFIIQDEVIKFSNIKTEGLFGYPPEELAAIPFTNHIHPADRETAPEQFRKDSREDPLKPLSFRIRNKSGQEIWVELKSVGIEWEGKSATLNFASDITEQKKLEAQFLQAQKMEAVGRLAGGVAHDFNNLLTVINSNSQLALMELKEWDPLREKFESIQKAGERAANLTRQLLAFSRRQVVEMKVIDLNLILQDLEKMLRRVIGEDIELTILLDKDFGRVKADPGQIEQAILNLVVNARDAMPSGGKLTIETGNVISIRNMP